MQQSSLAGKSALDLFPDLFTAPAGAEQAESLAPPPPDKDWLADCQDTGDTTRAANIPAALVAIVADQRRIQAVDTLKRMGYRVWTWLWARTRGWNSCGSPTTTWCCASGRCCRPPSHHPPVPARPATAYLLRHRRAPAAHLYDLEALAFSANLVINDREMPHTWNRSCARACRDEKLFRPLLDALAAETSALP